MQLPVMTCSEVRSLEQHAIESLGVSSLLLMENAGHDIAGHLVGLGVNGRVLILCGKGNNGGDGLVVGRQLHQAGIPVRVLLFAKPEHLSHDAAINHQMAKACQVDIRDCSGDSLDKATIKAELESAEWIVDALFGSGTQGALRSPFSELVEWVNASQKRVLAVDIPSGLNGDTGEPMGNTIWAECTVTMIAVKKGFLNSSAKEWFGKLLFSYAGFPRHLLEEYPMINPKDLS